MRWYSFIFIVKFVLLFMTRSKADWENRLVLETFKSDPNASMVVATLPLRLFLCKLASVAEGATKDQLLKALEMDNVEKAKNYFSSLSKMLNKLKETDLTMLNKLYVNYSREVDTSFLANSSQLYGVDAESIGFNMPRTAFSFINNGIASATYRRIRDVIKFGDITNQTKMMMITAAYLKASWEVPFEIEKTHYRKFYHLTSNKVTDIPMMVQEEHYLQYEDKHFKILSTRLRSPHITFTLVVPISSRGLTDFLSQLQKNPNLIKEARKSMTHSLKKLVMPRFKIKSYLDLTEILKTSSIKEILNSNCPGLNTILRTGCRNTSSNMFVSKILQKVFLDVDEFGVSRQVQTPVESGPAQGPMSATEFVADRPFYFTFDLEEFVSSYDRLTIVHHPLLHGVYYGPENTT